jgi:hypothetical protein
MESFTHYSSREPALSLAGTHGSQARRTSQGWIDGLNRPISLPTGRQDLIDALAGFNTEHDAFPRISPEFAALR